MRLFLVKLASLILAVPLYVFTLILWGFEEIKWYLEKLEQRIRCRMIDEKIEREKHGLD